MDLFKSHKLRDISIWRSMSAVVYVFAVAALIAALVNHDIKLAILAGLAACGDIIVKSLVAYFDEYRLTSTVIYRTPGEDDIYIHIHNTQFYTSVYPLRVDADGVRIANVGRGRNADVPIPRAAKNVTLSMKRTIGRIDLTRPNSEVILNTWVLYDVKNKKKYLKCTVTHEGEQIDNKKLMERYTHLMEYQQELAVKTLLGVSIPLVCLIGLFIAFFII